MCSSRELTLRASDYDNTLTRPTRSHFISVWKVELQKVLNIPQDDLERHWRRATNYIAQNKSLLGWERNGRIVAPVSGQSIRANVITRRIVEQLRDEPRHPRRLDALESDVLLDSLYQKGRPYAKWKFRPDAKDFIRDQHSAGGFSIVTNSRADIVTHELDDYLGVGHGIHVVGNSRKYEVSSNKKMTVPGLDRPVYIDRSIYRKILRRLLGKGSGYVIGDVAELDLYAGLFLGMHAILLADSDTPAWETNYISNHPRGKVVRSLDDASRYINSL